MDNFKASRNMSGQGRDMETLDEKKYSKRSWGHPVQPFLLTLKLSTKYSIALLAYQNNFTVYFHLIMYTRSLYALVTCPSFHPCSLTYKKNRPLSGTVCITCGSLSRALSTIAFIPTQWRLEEPPRLFLEI